MEGRQLLQYIIDTSDVVLAKKQEATEYLEKLEAAQVQADGACACGSKDWFHYKGDPQWYCSQCKSPRH